MIASDPTRRQVLRRAGVGGLTLAGAGAAFTGLTAAEIDSDATPDHVEIYYDESRLERYEPLLDMDIAAVRRNPRVYGYVAESAEHELDALCYWCRYTVQEGFLSLDSHQYDHEPSYVFVDPETESVEEVVFTGYHHFAASVRPSESDEHELATTRAEDPTHAPLTVISPWHHYVWGEPSRGAFRGLSDWTSARGEWDNYGFYEGTADEAVDNPHTMLERSSWWDEEEAPMDYHLGRLWLALGLAPDDRAELDRE